MNLRDALPRAYIIANWRDYEVGCLLEMTAEQAGRMNLEFALEQVPCMWCQTYDKPEEAN